MLIAPVPRFIPAYFEKDISTGIPSLTSAGRSAVGEEFAESSPYRLEDHRETFWGPDGGTSAQSTNSIVGS